MSTITPDSTQTVARAVYRGPTDHNGARYIVTDLRSGGRRIVGYDHAASNARVQAVADAFGIPGNVPQEPGRATGRQRHDAWLEGSPIAYGGEDAAATYYIVTGYRIEA